MFSTIPSSYTGILLITHAPLATALKVCALHAFSEYESCIEAYDALPELSPEQGLASCLRLAQNLCGEQLLIMTDIIGATPYNLSIALQTKLQQLPHYLKPTQLVTGTNVPMLLRALTYNQKPIDELAQLVIEGGIKGISTTAPSTQAL